MTMDHAAAHEELADLALEPQRLRRLAVDPTPELSALRAHLDACPVCRAELQAWAGVHRALDIATSEGADPLASDDASRSPLPPPALRSGILAAVAATRPTDGIEVETGPVVPDDGPTALPWPGRREQPELRRRPGPRGRTLGRMGRLGWLAAAAALVVALGAGALLVQRSGEVDQARQQAAAIGTAATTLDRILAAPTHWVATLRTADGTPGGTLAWSPSEVVVLATALGDPQPGVTYRCWIEHAGTRTPVGEMAFAGGVGYWAGANGSWGDLAPGNRFGVTAVDAAGHVGPALLVADL
jgi:hypothetical protein